jgi:outer membrane protein TolC
MKMGAPFPPDVEGAVRLIALASAVCLAPLSFAIEQAPSSVITQPFVLTLDQAIQIALHDNRDLGLASRELEKAARQVELARVDRYPKLGVSFVNPWFFTDLDLHLSSLGVIGLPSHFSFTTVTLAQPISKLYDIGLGVKASELTRDANTERLRAARQLVVNQVKRGYYGCLRAETGLKPSREALELFRELERVVASLADERAALESDLLEVQARRALQEHEVIILEDALSSGRERLNVALGRDADTPFSLESIPVTLPAEADLAEARVRGLEHRPDVREARIRVELARTDERLKKAERWPMVGAQFNYIYNHNFPPLPSNIAALTVQASWEPFDWGRKSKETANKELVVVQAETSLRQLEASVRVDLNEKFRALRSARSLTIATELGERAAREKLRVTLGRHKENAVLTKDLLQAQVGLADAEQKYQAALIGYWEARADFEKAMAEDR